MIFHKRFFITPQKIYKTIQATYKTSSQLSDFEYKGQTYIRDEWTNITPKIASLIEKKLHLQKYHPLCLVKERIANFMQTQVALKHNNPFPLFDNFNPVVTIKENFDSLLIPLDHPSRRLTDTYYINREQVLRCHTSAHQVELLQSGLNSFLVAGDVYRKDQIDACHYPIFHQLEDIPLRWVDTYFPFTNPSWELEVQLDNKWIEMLGCGIICQQILRNAGIQNRVGWAFGLGLERFAMIMYIIPDIRLFWSKDPGFLKQFDKKTPFSKIKFKEADFLEIIRNIVDNYVESVELIDKFNHPYTGRKSLCYRITYRHMEKTLTQEEVNKLHNEVVSELTKQLDITVRSTEEKNM